MKKNQGLTLIEVLISLCLITGLSLNLLTSQNELTQVFLKFVKLIFFYLTSVNQLEIKYD